MMDDISTQHRKEISFVKSLEECFCYTAHVNDNCNLEALLLLLKNTIDPDEVIKEFEFDEITITVKDGKKKIKIDMPEKIYDYLVEEYPYEPKMISRELFKEIFNLMQKQNERNIKLGKAFIDYADSVAIVIDDSYSGALDTAIQHLVDFSDLLGFGYMRMVKCFGKQTRMEKK